MKLPEKILAVSPHLDDVVFSCGELVAQVHETVVVTVFAGIPAMEGVLTDWDSSCGFGDARQAMVARREEDRKAMRVVSATPLWLDFLDSQYGPSPSPEVLADALRSLIEDVQPAGIVVPAGLFHSDHAIVHQAMLIVHRQNRDKSWWMYEDALYRRIPALLQCRLTALLRANIHATPAALLEGRNFALKREGVACYASQLHGLEHKSQEGYSDVFAPERYWRLDFATANGMKATP
jgi:LmbE family N-acetylglucosaminyl deacetylase